MSALVIDADCLDRWMADFDDFRSDFLYIIYNACKALGCELEFDQKQLGTAHAAWVAAHTLWLHHRVSASSALSHYKILAILLVKLSTVNWIKNLFEYAGEDVIFNGSSEQREEARKDLLGGRESFLAMHFVLCVLNWFEVRRTDKHDPFVYRMTPDLQFDMLVYLNSNEVTDSGVFLALKALYARD